MKPKFVMRWMTSTDGRWDIECPADGKGIQLNEFRTVAVFDGGRKADRAWVVVGRFDTVEDAIQHAERLSAKGRAA